MSVYKYLGRLSAPVLIPKQDTVTITGDGDWYFTPRNKTLFVDYQYIIQNGCLREYGRTEGHAISLQVVKKKH